jgi:hypothetical protein
MMTKLASQFVLARKILQMKMSLTRCDLVVVVGDEGAGEP